MKTTDRFTTVLLDAGGVLLDETDHEDAWARALCEVLEISREVYEADVEESVRIFCPRVYQYVVWKRVEPDLATFERSWKAARDSYHTIRPPLRIMDGIRCELQAMAGRLRIGIAGQYGAELLEALEGAELLDHFEWRLTQDDFDITKPDPRYLVKIAKACGVRPEECIEVGDRIDKDVVPAKHAGMGTILVRTGIHHAQQPRLPEEIPDVELPGVAGLGQAALRLAGR